MSLTRAQMRGEIRTLTAQLRSSQACIDSLRKIVAAQEDLLQGEVYAANVRLASLLEGAEMECEELRGVVEGDRDAIAAFMRAHPNVFDEETWQ